MVEVLKALRARLILPMHYFNPYTLNRFLERIAADFRRRAGDRAHHRRLAADPAERAQGAGAAGELECQAPHLRKMARCRHCFT
jgi:L-ascorbate metabolism protein UlaG (beta-lactamase superfamily)